jgi:hypothetical protein
VSENTRKLCEGLILKPLGPTRVKGVSGPVNVYQVIGLGPLRTRLQRAAGHQAVLMRPAPTGTNRISDLTHNLIEAGSGRESRQVQILLRRLVVQVQGVAGARIDKEGRVRVLNVPEGPDH